MSRSVIATIAILAAAGLLAAGSQLAARVNVEAASRTVAVVLDYDEIRRLAAVSRADVGEVLRKLKCGATHIALAEMTWDDLRAAGLVETYAAAQIPRGYVPAGHVVVHVATWNLADSVTQALAKKGLGPARAADQLAVHSPLLPGGRSLVVPTAAALSPDLGLGYDPAAVAVIRRAGLSVVARPRPAMVSTPDAVRGSLALAKHTGARVVVFIGNEVLGNPAALSATASALRDLGLWFGMVEMSPQFGADRLAHLLGGQIIRVHSISEPEMHKFTAAQAVQRYIRAVRERGVRLLYVRLLPTASGDVLEANAAYLADLRDGLERLGYQLGDPQPLPDLSVPKPSRAAIGLGAAALALAILGALGLLSTRLWPALAAIISAASVALSAGPDIGRHLVALATVIAGACAVLLLLRPPETVRRAPLLRSLAWLAVSSAVTIAAAAVVAAPLNDHPPTTATEVFRGVKLSLLLPPLLVLLVHVARATETYWQWSTETGGDEWPALRAGLTDAASAAVRYWHVALAFALLAAAALLVVRSGNEPLFGLSGLELKARAALESLVGVRPRTKEFAVGHPLFLLGLWLFFRGRKRGVWLLIAGGAVGQASLANTFCHIHTPYLLSLQRAAAGLVGGLIIGLLLIAIWAVVERLSARWTAAR